MQNSPPLQERYARGRGLDPAIQMEEHREGFGCQVPDLICFLSDSSQ